MRDIESCEAHDEKKTETCDKISHAEICVLFLLGRFIVTFLAYTHI